MEGNNFKVIYVRNLNIYCTLMSYKMSDFLPYKTFVIEDAWLLCDLFQKEEKKKSGKVG